MFSWPIANKTYDQLCIIQNQGYAFVQNNNNGLIMNANIFNGLPNIVQQKLLSKSIGYPPSLNIQYQNGEYFFITEGYIYISLNIGLLIIFVSNIFNVSIIFKYFAVILLVIFIESIII